VNHTAPKSDVLHRHYAGLCKADVAGAMVQIQVALTGLMLQAILPVIVVFLRSINQPHDVTGCSKIQPVAKYFPY
jgi:hypothetical protein